MTGAVIGVYNLDQLSKILDISGFEKNGICEIIDANGDILAAKNNDNKIKDSNLFEYFKKVDLKKEYSLAQVEDNICNNRSSLVKYIDNGSNLNAFYCPIMVNNWFLYISIPNNIMDKFTTQNVKNAALLCSKVLIVIIIILVYGYHEKNKDLKRLASIDGLTGLYNFATMQKKVVDILQKDKSGCGTLIVLDVNNFKHFNDTYGHLVSDNILIEISNRIQVFFAKYGLCGRFGGDEFMIFISKKLDQDYIIKIAEDFSKSVSAMSFEEIDKEPISVSLGIAFCYDGQIKYETLFEKADECMYNVKRRGGKGVGVINL